MLPPFATVAPVRTICSLGYYGLWLGTGTVTGLAWPAAKRVIYLPFHVPEPITVRNLATICGSSVSGNIEVGIYSLSGKRLVTSGSTPQAGASNIVQVFSVTATPLGIGDYYFAVTMDNAVGLLVKAAPVVPICQSMGVRAETTGSFGLPAQATFGAPVDAYIPVVTLAQGAVL